MMSANKTVKHALRGDAVYQRARVPALLFSIVYQASNTDGGRATIASLIGTFDAHVATKAISFGDHASFSWSNCSHSTRILAKKTARGLQKHYSKETRPSEQAPQFILKHRRSEQKVVPLRCHLALVSQLAPPHHLAHDLRRTCWVVG